MGKIRVENKAILSILLLNLVLPVVLSGCNSAVSSNEGDDQEITTSDGSDISVKDNSDEIIADVDSPDDNPLAGTCPKDKHCSGAGCGLYVDNNDNGLCDRGE